MITLWYECLKMAVRELRRHKTRTMLTTLGIIIGVSAVIVTVSVTQGAKTNLEGDIKNLKTCQSACSGVDYVLHQAALGSVPVIGAALAVTFVTTLGWRL